MRRFGRVFEGAIISLAIGSAVAACNNSGGSDAKAPVQCGGEARVQLDCSTEFKYEGRNIEGGFQALGLGSASAKTDEVALRQIDQQTEQYAAQARRLCDEYNACVLDKDTYATRSENLRRRMSKVPELYDGVKGAPNEDARRKALLAAAEDAFLEKGLAASMDDIAKRAGVSKKTIYGCVATKELLFAGVIRSRIENSQVHHLPETVADVRAIEEALVQFFVQLARFVLSPPSVRLYRTVAAEATRFRKMVTP